MDINHDKYMNHENDRMKTVKSIIGLSLWHDVQMKNRKIFTSWGHEKATKCSVKPETNVFWATRFPVGLSAN